MSSSVSDANLEKKFQSVTNTQDSIQTLSLWLLHHKAHHQKIVSSWMKVLQKVKISHRLTLFYLANDVVQNGKRKGFLQFGNSFAEVLREATLLVRDEQIRPAISRVFTIWEHRSIYTPEFIADLRAILANTKVPATAPSKLLAEFKPEVVIEKIKLSMKLETETASKLSTINLSKLNATNAEIVQQLKDRNHGQQFKRDFDESTRALEELIKTMNKEIEERTKLILLLEQSEIYYDTQRGEAKVVVNAYKNFGMRVKTLQKKLEELTATFPSPLPSPCPDAPSPTTSDQELELNLPNDRGESCSENESKPVTVPHTSSMHTNDLENLENVPSPVGSPEGLNLSPEPKEVETKPPPVSSQSIGNPIPTLSNFFSHEQSGMTSWLDAFSSKKSLVTPSEKQEITKNDPSSLDSRLSNLLQNIPNLPSSLQSTIFGNTSSGNATPLQDTINSPLANKKDKISEPTISGEVTTPIKDEYSGQNTPLQDEDTHSSHSFFSKLASSNKTHSPKDILSSLTNLIQSASGDKADENHKKENYVFSSSESYDVNSGMSTFIKKIIPSVSQASQHSSSPSYFNSSQPVLSEPIRTIPVAQTSTVNSYQTAPYHDVPTYSSKTTDRGEPLSFIPSLVPSTPHDNFNFTETFPAEEYNPEMETFDTDMDIENAISNDGLEVPSPEIEPLSPVPPAPVGEIPRPIGARRLSTLITVVTKDSPNESLPVDQPFPSEDTYKVDKENGTQAPSSWLDNSSVHAPKTVISQDSMVKSSPTEEFFIGKEAATIPPFYTVPPPPVISHGPANGQNVKYIPPTTNPMNLPLSRIETVQSHREDLNGRWFGNNWGETEQRNFIPQGPPPMPCRVQDTRFFENKRNFPPPNFHPRNNWSRNRPDNSFHHPYGPPQSKRFPFRGRNWGRPQPRY